MYHCLAIFYVQCHRLFTQNMDTLLQQIYRNGPVRLIICHNDHRVKLFLHCHFHVIRVDLDLVGNSQQFHCFLRFLQVQIANCFQLCIGIV